MSNLEYFGSSASFMSVLKYLEIKKVEITPQKILENSLTRIERAIYC